MTTTSSSGTSKAALWTGRLFSFLPLAMLLMSAIMLLTKSPQVVEGFGKFGYPESCILPLGAVLLTSIILYLIPPTSLIGAILLTGYLGGAVATHVHAKDPLLNIFMPAIFGAFLWGGLCLRDARVRAVLPWKK